MIRNTAFFILGVFIATLSLLSSATAQADRQSYIKETLLDMGEHGYRWQRGSDAAILWHKVLRQMGIENIFSKSQNFQHKDCVFETALKTLNEIREQLGSEHPYEKIWAENQNRVFSACHYQPPDTPPSTPEGDNLPDRSDSDFQYQLASWHFYRGEFDEALELYQEVANNPAAPMRPRAAYMVVRTLAYLNKDEAAYHKIGEILKDPSFASVHDIAANYRFILAYGGTNSDTYALEHLKWLLTLIRTKPEKGTNIEQSFQDYRDAMIHLNWYFPYGGKSVDWWLRDDVKLGSSRMKAVRKMAVEDELVDWMQATWALNAFDVDWLWALHYADSPYWQQNQHIVDHAWQRWQQGDGLEWLEIAITRTHPQSMLVEAIVTEAAIQLARNWKDETAEFKKLREVLWLHSVRLRLGRGEYEETLSLIQTTELTDLYLPEEVLRWLVYTGQWDEARRFLDYASPVEDGQYVKNSIIPIKTTTRRNQEMKGHHFWRALLARNWQEAMLAAGMPYQYNYIDDSPSLWQSMVNFLPASKLAELAQNPQVHRSHRPILALSALTRALLLGYDQRVQDYAVLVEKVMPELRPYVLKAAEGKKSDHIRLMLQVPRMRPIPFTLRQKRYGAVNADPLEIDTYNHNDNNWWCRLQQPTLDQYLFDAAFITPQLYRPWGGYDYRDIYYALETAFGSGPTYLDEIATYLAKQKVQLSQHPFRDLVDESELAALETIPSAPQYLSEAVIQREKFRRWMIWRSGKSKNESASDLHHAVRTARYGCQRNGSYATYSQAAFKILHQSYGDTVWAKTTPYWFGCKHFRWGCYTKRTD